MPIEGEFAGHGVSGKFKIEMGIPISKLKPCQAQIVPSWNWRQLKNEKWFVKQDYDGNFVQKKIGDESQD